MESTPAFVRVSASCVFWLDELAENILIYWPNVRFNPLQYKCRPCYMLRVGENIVVQYLPVWNKQPNRAASLSRKYEESAHKNNTLKDTLIQP